MILPSLINWLPYSCICLQEAFEQKQETMFVALDKLFILHNALLVESRSIKVFFLYSISMFVIYLSTSTKQTYKVRPILYIGKCIVISVYIGRSLVICNYINIFVLLSQVYALHFRLN